MLWRVGGNTGFSPVRGLGVAKLVATQTPVPSPQLAAAQSVTPCPRRPGVVGYACARGAAWVTGLNVTKVTMPIRTRARRTGVHYCSLPEPYSLLRQMALDLLEQTLSQIVPLQQVAKVEYRALVGNVLQQPQPGKAPHRLRVVQQVLHGRITQVVAQLHDMHPQHHRQRVGTPASFPTEVMGPTPLLQALPRH